MAVRRTNVAGWRNYSEHLADMRGFDTGAIINRNAQ